MWVLSLDRDSENSITGNVAHFRGNCMITTKPFTWVISHIFVGIESNNLEHWHSNRARISKIMNPITTTIFNVI